MFSKNRMVYLGSAMVTKNPKLIRYKNERYYCDMDSHIAVKSLVNYLNNDFIEIERIQKRQRDEFEKMQKKELLYKPRIIYKNGTSRKYASSTIYTIWEVLKGYDLLKENPEKVIYKNKRFFCNKKAEREIKAVVNYENGGRTKSIDCNLWSMIEDYKTEELIRVERKEFMIARAKYYFDLGNENKAIRIILALSKKDEKIKEKLFYWYLQKGEREKAINWQID